MPQIQKNKFSLFSISAVGIFICQLWMPPAMAQVQTEVGTTYYRNAVDFNDGTMSEGLSYSAGIGGKVSSHYSLSFDTSYNQDLVDSAYSGLEDSTLTFSRKSLELSKDWNLSGNIKAIIPTSKRSSQIDNLKLGYRVGARVGLSPERLAGWALGFGVSIGQNIHQYETNANGSVLIAFVSSQSLSLSKELIERLNLSLNISNRYAISYQNNLRQSFEHTETLAYQLNDIFGLSVGHSNSGNVLKPDGFGSNFALFNENTSIFFMSISAGF